MCSGYINNVLVCSRESTKELCPVKDLKAELGSSLNFFVMRKDRCRLNKIIRLEIIDVGCDLGVIYLDALGFQDLCSLTRVIVRTSDNKTRMLCKPRKSVHRYSADADEIYVL